ncbi:MAG: four helix bundle protein [Bacteroidetes bacterium]|nr:four helix bundle protein [Bacteroidota bacterium]
MEYSYVDISEEFLWLGAEIVMISGKLAKTSNYGAMINQLLRSGTSAGANYEEACGAQSKADFIHKLHICFKELKETNYWLRLIEMSKILPADSISPALGKSQMLLNIIGKSLVTSKRNKDEK